MFVYHLGYWLNAYAGWYRIVHFSEPVEIVRWLKAHAQTVEKIDFIVFRVD